MKRISQIPFMFSKKSGPYLPSVVFWGVVVWCYWGGFCCCHAETPRSIFTVSMKEFLSMISGEIRLGNQTIRLPQDLPQLLQGENEGIERSPAPWAQRRSYDDEGIVKVNFKPFQHRYDDFGWGWDGDGWGWGWEEEKQSGLISLSNFFRVGCILFDLKEIKASARNGLFGDKKWR